MIPRSPSRPPRRSDAAWVGAGFVVTILATLASNILVVRSLRVQAAGGYFIILSFVTVLAIVLRLGLDKTMVLAVSEWVLGKRYTVSVSPLWAGLVLLVITSLPFCAFLVIGGWASISVRLFQDSSLMGYSTLIASWLLSDTLRLVISESLRGDGKIVLCTIAGNAGRSALYFLGMGFGALLGIHTLPEVLFVNVAASVASLVIAVTSVLLHRHELLVMQGWQIYSPVVGLARDSAAFYLTSLMSFVTNGADVLLAGLLFSKSDVAFYGACVKLTQILSFPTIALTLFLGPLIPRMLVNRDHAKLERLIRTSSSLLAFPVLILASIFIFAPGATLSAVYSPRFSPAGGILMILSLGPLTTTLTGPNAFTLMMARQGRAVLAATFVVVPLQVVSMIVLGARYGVMGLAVASTAGTVALNVWYSLSVRARLRIGTEPFIRWRQWRTMTRDFRSLSRRGQ